MAALYLLGNPDHYTSHKFVVVYWKNFVREALKPFRSEEDLEEELPEKLVLQKGKGEYVGFSSVHCRSFLISVTIGHNLLCVSQFGLPS